MTYKRIAKSIWRWLFIAEDTGSIAGIVAMTGLVFVQVMLRIFLKWSSPTLEEAARFAMVWSILIGAVITTREDGHIKMGGVFHSKKSLLIFGIVSRLSCLAFMCIFAKWSYDFALYSLAKSMQSIVLQVPLIVVHSCFFICGVFIALHFLVLLVRQIINYRKACTQC